MTKNILNFLLRDLKILGDATLKRIADSIEDYKLQK